MFLFGCVPKFNLESQSVLYALVKSESYQIPPFLTFLLTFTDTGHIQGVLSVVKLISYPEGIYERTLTRQVCSRVRVLEANTRASSSLCGPELRATPLTLNTVNDYTMPNVWLPYTLHDQKYGCRTHHSKIMGINVKLVPLLLL
jgi:hypothetical protein